MPKTFTISSYQCLIQRKKSAGIIFAKRLHDSEEEDCFNFIRDGNAESISICISKALKLSDAKSTWTTLAETGSSNLETRLGYLKKSILDSGFPRNASFEK